MKHILIFLGLIAFTVSAQPTKSFEQDTLAFRSCLWNYNIGTAMNVPMIMETYKTLSDESLKGKFYSDDPIPPPGMGFTHYSYRGPIDGLASIVRYGDVNVGDWHPCGGAFYPEKLSFRPECGREFRRCARLYRKSVKDIKVEKARLVENLRKFDAVSNNKPIFFSTIYSEYKGDIEKYVDDLYSKSIMGSKWRMTLFCRWPSAKKLQKDLSVQFAIGLALYDLWIKQTKEEMAATNE